MLLLRVLYLFVLFQPQVNQAAEKSSESLVGVAVAVARLGRAGQVGRFGVQVL
jgi:hypothetical protein